jgi:AraC-like DNA-binding protein
MEPSVFSTANLAPADRSEAWRRWFWPVFDVVPKTAPDESFHARNQVWNLGGMVVSHVAAPAAAEARTRANIARTPVDHWVLSCSRTGMTKVQTDKMLLTAPPNVPFIWSLGETSRSERTQIDGIQILMPRDMFPGIRMQLDALTGSVIETPLGAVLSEYMTALDRWLPSIAPDALPQITLSVHSMISACLSPNADHMEYADAEMSSLHLNRVKRAVRVHLRSPSLRPEELSKMVGISRSSLYRLFEYSGGIVRYIQRQRLLAAHAVLSDPSGRQTILAVSEEFCFADASSFSRAFRREFGHSPSEARAAAANGNPVPPFSLPREPAAATSFADFLREA